MMKVYFGEGTTTEGNKHSFLGMNITTTQDECIQIEMKDQLQEAVEAFELCEGAKILELVTSLVQKHLHITNKDCENFTNEKEEVFHSVVAKLLWIMKKARLNLETSASSHARELRKVIMMIGKK